MILRILLFAALISVVTLVAIPSSQFIVRRDVASLVGMDRARRETDSPPKSVANDIDVQMRLAAVWKPEWSARRDWQITVEPRVTALHALATRFPGQPVIYVRAMRMALRQSIMLHRPEETPLLLPDVRPSVWKVNKAALTAYESDAATAVRLDSDNGYAHALAAVGCYVSHRDDEGLREVERAGKCPVWREYYDSEVNGACKLATARLGGQDAEAYLHCVGSILLPELATLRSMARVVVSQAGSDERRGDVAAGMRKRRAIRLLGDSMQKHSWSVWGCAVGSSLVGLSFTHIAGLQSKVNSERGGWIDSNAALYCAYLRSHGYSDECRSVAEDAPLATSIQAVGDTVRRNRKVPAVEYTTMRRRGASVLFASITCGLFGIVCLLAIRLPWAHQNSPWSPEVRWGIGAGIVGIVIAILLICDQSPGLGQLIDGMVGNPRGTATPVALTAILGALMLGLRGIEKRFLKPQLQPIAASVLCAIVGLLAVVLAIVDPPIGGTTVALLMIGGFASCRFRACSLQTFTGVALMTAGLIGVALVAGATGTANIAHIGDVCQWYTSADQANDITTVRLFIGTTAIVCGIAAVTTALVSRSRPIGTIATRRMAIVLPAAACILVTVYAILVPFTARANAAALGQIRAMISDGPTYAAKSLGRVWPAR